MKLQELSKLLKQRVCECSDWSNCISLPHNPYEKLVGCIQSCGKMLKRSCFERRGFCSDCHSFDVADRNAATPAELRRQKNEGDPENTLSKPVSLPAKDSSLQSANCHAAHSPRSYRDALVMSSTDYVKKAVEDQPVRALSPDSPVKHSNTIDPCVSPRYDLTAAHVVNELRVEELPEKIHLEDFPIHRTNFRVTEMLDHCETMNIIHDDLAVASNFPTFYPYQ